MSGNPQTASPQPALVNLDHVAILPRWALQLRPATALRRRVLPLCEIDGCLIAATIDPEDETTRRAVERGLGHPAVRLVAAEPDSLDRALHRVFGTGGSDSVPTSAASTTASPGTGSATTTEYVNQVDAFIDAATLRQASDIHLEPGPISTVVRFRVHGQLEDTATLPIAAYPGVVGRIKVLANLDIAEKRLPQDGQISHTSPRTGRRSSIRVATMPTRHGERITLRFLGVHASTITLQDIGIPEDSLDAFTTAIGKPHGLVILTGPTGSGKTSTMYAALRHIAAIRRCAILTIEDPVECDLPGVTQVDLDGGRLTYPRALRSALRHDPDVLLVGEIRDPESAEIAIRAALTGHLVLTTLHTHSAVGAITRLLDLGIEPYLLASTLNAVAAQRLVRRLCPHCRTPTPLGQRDALALRKPDLAASPSWYAPGCLYCGGLGEHGRHALFEILSFDDALSQAVAARTSENEILSLARKSGARTLADHGLHAIHSGITSPSHVIQTLASFRD